MAITAPGTGYAAHQQALLSRGGGLQMLDPLMNPNGAGMQYTQGNSYYAPTGASRPGGGGTYGGSYGQTTGYGNYQQSSPFEQLMQMYGQQQGGGGGGAPALTGNTQMSGNSVGGYASQTGGVGGLGGNMQQQIMQLLNMQLAENQRASNKTEGAYNEAKGILMQGPGRYDADPLTQAARQRAQLLAADPEALNDITMQKIVNRSSNLANSAARQRERGALGELAEGGQLGGSAEQQVMGNLAGQQMSELANIGSNAEIMRANQRNQDIMNATNLAGGLGAQRDASYQNMSNTLFTNPLRVEPMDLSGLVAALAGANVSSAVGGGQVNFGTPQQSAYGQTAGGGGQPRIYLGETPAGQRQQSTYAGTDFIQDQGGGGNTTSFLTGLMNPGTASTGGAYGNPAPGQWGTPTMAGSLGGGSIPSLNYYQNSTQNAQGQQTGGYSSSYMQPGGSLGGMTGPSNYVQRPAYQTQRGGSQYGLVQPGM